MTNQADCHTLPLMHAAARKPLTRWAIQAQSGDREAMGKVVAQLEPLIGSRAAASCNGNSALKDDIEQHLRLRLIELVHRYDPHDYNEFLTYVYVFMSYDGYKVAKTNNRYAPCDVDPETETWAHLTFERDLADIQDASDTCKTLVNAISELTGIEKRVAILAFWEDLKPREIAKRCKMTARDTFKLIADLRKRLREICDAQDT